MMAGVRTIGNVCSQEVEALFQRTDPGHRAQNKEVLPRAMPQGTHGRIRCLPVSGQCKLQLANSLCYRTDNRIRWETEEVTFKVSSNFVFNFPTSL